MAPCLRMEGASVVAMVGTTGKQMVRVAGDQLELQQVRNMENDKRSESPNLFFEQVEKT